jgi:hypothetical protein
VYCPLSPRSTAWAIEKILRFCYATQSMHLHYSRIELGTNLMLDLK